MRPVALAALAVFLGSGCTPDADLPKGDGADPPTDPHPPTTSPPTDATTPTPPTPPTDATCDDEAPPAFAVPVDPGCVAEPPVGGFDPVIEWVWTDNPIHPTYDEVVVTPVVINLTDDDGDGLVDHRDVPDIVFVAFEGIHYGGSSALTAISGADGATLWSVLDPMGYQPRGTGGIAAGDLDGDGVPEIVVTAIEGLLCVHADGTFAWLAPAALDSSAMPAIGDLDGDGVPEIVVGRMVFEHDGAARWTGTEGQGGAYHVASFPADLDGDGLAEVIAGNTVYEHDGTVRWFDGLHDGKPAVADFDGDGAAEVVRVFGETVQLTDGDGTPLWTYALTDLGGGAPTVADFDGDGAPEIGVASQSLYRMLDADGTLLWSMPIEDVSSAMTGSSAFDFEGDGAIEVVYADEHTLWVFDGATGAVKLAWTAHGSGTLHEYPVIADVDRDGSAEIVLPNNDYAWGDTTGITVIGDAARSWSPARPVWNQHAYAITNVDDDGRIPATPTASWLGQNSFRAADSTPRPPVPEADLGVGEPSVCLDTCDAGHVDAWFPVSNAGAADAGSATLTVSRLDGAVETLVDSVSVGVVVAGAGVWAGPVTLTAADFGPDGVSVGLSTPEDATADCDPSDDRWLWAAYPCP